MDHFDEYLNKIASKVPTLQVQLESPRHNFSYKYSSHEDNQLFHSASIGKVFCASLIMMAVENDHFTLDSQIAPLLEENFLNNLFVYKGTDYQDQVTIRHLLSHTSGVNDYFEGKTKKGHDPFLKRVMQDKDHLFKPAELVDFTRNYQEAVAKPGDKFLYSDTGYVLLGFLLERLHKKPYAAILQEKICQPLGLKDTALCFHDENFTPEKLAPILFEGTDMHLAKSLSCDYSGGGLQTTTEDLILFLQGLFEGKLVSKASVELMLECKNSFHGFMRYGLGIVEVQFQRLAFWMRNYPPLYGGLGSLSVHAFYDPKNADVYIINLGDASKMRLSFLVLARMAKWLNKSLVK